MPPPIGRPRSSRCHRKLTIFLLLARPIHPIRKGWSRSPCAPVANAELVGGADDIDWTALAAAKQQRYYVGRAESRTGASAPEEITREVIAAFEARFHVQLEELSGIEERMHFKLPRSLRNWLKMAVFTQITQTALDAFLTGYGLSPPFTATGIAAGVQNYKLSGDG